MSGFFKKRLAPTICSSIPLGVWHRLIHRDFVLPYYHCVSDDDVLHVSGLYKFKNVRQFITDIEFFLRNYTPVSLQDVISHVAGEKPLPGRSFLLTFDDGFRENHDIIAPLLLTKGIPAVFFPIASCIDNRRLCYAQKKSLVLKALAARDAPRTMHAVSESLDCAGIPGSDAPSRISAITYRHRRLLDELGGVLDCDFVGYVARVKPYLTSQQIRSLLHQGFAIGAHSMDHPYYPELSLEEQLTQTLGSIDVLSKQFEYECQSFAFPFTDVGVSPQFFEKAFGSGKLRVSFGTGGLRSHHFALNLPRFTMERTALPARQVLTRQFCKALVNRP